MDAYKVDAGKGIIFCETDDAIRSIVKSLVSRRLLFFFGAGVSIEYPSFLPLAMNSHLPGLKQMLVDTLICRVPNRIRSTVSDDLSKLSLEQILDHFVRILGDEALQFLDVLKTETNSIYAPNYRHYSLALLAKHDLCRHFLTVNFDTMIERAFMRFGIPLTVPEHFRDEQEKYIKTIESSSEEVGAYLYKLHGSIKSKETLLTTVERVATGLPPYKRSILEALLPAYDAFVMGYSDNDLDVFPTIRSIASNRMIIWYELKDKPGEHIQEFLAKRPHYIIIGDLDEIFQAILQCLDLDDSLIFHEIGVSSLSQIKILEDENLQSRKQELLSFRDKYADSMLPTAAVCLILSNILSVEKHEIRDDLFNSVRPDDLSANLRYSYWAESAERQHSDGNLTSAIKYRKIAIQQLHLTEFTPEFKLKILLEQKARLGDDLIGLFKRKGSVANVLRGLLCLFKVSSRLYLQGQKLDSFERGTLRSMMYFHSGDLLQFIVERLILIRIKSRSKGKKAILQVLARFIAGISERLFRYGRNVKQQATGWYLLHTQRLAEMIMHKTGICTTEARQLIEITRRLGRDEASLKVKRVELGPHEGLMWYSLGEIPKAIDILNLTYKEYEKTKHRSGKVKTLLFLALCYEKEKDEQHVHKCLSNLDALMKEYE